MPKMLVALKKEQDVLQFARRLCFTVAAPPSWNASQPLFPFRPPCPQEDMIRASLLFQQGVKGTQQEDGEMGGEEQIDDDQNEARNVDVEIKHDIFHAGGRTAVSKHDLEDLLDMDLNPDLE